MNQQTNLHYEGLTTPAACAQCGHLNPTYVQGPAGPERRDARANEGLALVRVFPWSESCHSQLAGLVKVGDQPTAEEAIAVHFLAGLRAAYINDGRLDAGEVASEAAKAFSELSGHPELPGRIQQAVGLITGLLGTK